MCLRCLVFGIRVVLVLVLVLRVRGCGWFDGDEKVDLYLDLVLLLEEIFKLYRYMKNFYIGSLRGVVWLGFSLNLDLDLILLRTVWQAEQC
jgi:hypothetical protein